MDAELLESLQHKHAIKLVGPVLADNSWQAKAGKGFDLAHFQIDWQNQQATCPQGQTSSSFRVAGERMEVVFASQVCACCPVRSDCTQSQTTGRVLHLRPQAANFALHARREEQQTPAFRQQYATRAGIARDALPSRWENGAATSALRWAGQNAFATRFDRCGDQSGAH